MSLRGGRYGEGEIWSTGWGTEIPYEEIVTPDLIRGV
ncbi:hypothetical protein SPAN111604_14975 [Sphingomonas antarctica]